MSVIYFHTEEVDFHIDNPETVKHWISTIITNYDYTLKELNFVFCSDKYLHKINVDYLDHDFLTDIITFDQSEIANTLESDIFISVERVRENAADLNHTFTDELHRVIIHGVLHLLGFGDSTVEEKQAMREKEEACLSLRP